MATPFHTEIMTYSPEIWLRMNETSGTTAADSSGNGLDFTITGAPTLGASRLLMDSGNTSFNFGGSSDYLSRASVTQTISTVVIVTDMNLATAGSVSRALSRQFYSSTFYYYLYLYYLNSSYYRIALQYYYGGSAQVVHSADIPHSDETKVIAVVYDSAQPTYKVRMFLNGVLVKENTASVNPFSRGFTGTYYVGGNVPNYLSGKMDGFAGITSALSDSQVLDLYNASRITAEASDGLKLSESISLNFSLSQAVSDSPVFSELFDFDFVYGIIDRLNLNETLSLKGSNYTRGTSDSFVMSESLEGFTGLLETVSDIFKLSDTTITSLFTSALETINFNEYFNNQGSTYHITVEDIAQFIEVFQNIIREGNLSLSESVDFSEQVVIDNIFTISEIITLTESLSRSSVSAYILSEIITLSETLVAPLNLLVVDSVMFSDILSSFVNQTVKLSERFRGSDSLTIKATHYALLTESIKILEYLLPFYAETLIDGVKLGDVLSSAVDAKVSLLESLIVSDTPTNSAAIYALVPETVDFSESLVTQATFNEALSDGFIIRIGDDTEDTYLGWVLNPENFAVSNYTNYNFNSMCNFNGMVLMANTNGLYQMEGNMDEASYITARVQTPAMQLGTSNKKQVPEIYLGVSNSKKVVLRVSVDGRSTVDYILNKSSTNLQTQTMSIGKGLIGRYWQFELITKDNTEFDLESIEFYPVSLGRKI